MNCRQSQCFTEHKTVRRGWFIVAGRTRALLCMHIVCVLMELWPLSRSISKTWNHDNTLSGLKWLKFTNWNFWLSECSFFFPFSIDSDIINSLSRLPLHCLIHILFISPCCPSCSISARTFHSLLLHLFLLHFPRHPLHPSFSPLSPSLLLGAKSRQLPVSLSRYRRRGQ